MIRHSCFGTNFSSAGENMPFRPGQPRFKSPLHVVDEALGRLPRRARAMEAAEEVARTSMEDGVQTGSPLSRDGAYHQCHAVARRRPEGEARGLPVREPNGDRREPLPLCPRLSRRLANHRAPSLSVASRTSPLPGRHRQLVIEQPPMTRSTQVVRRAGHRLGHAHCSRLDVGRSGNLFIDVKLGAVGDVVVRTT